MSKRLKYLPIVIIRLFWHGFLQNPHRWQTFVANRVVRIQEAVPNISWNRVRMLANPADCGTRGMQLSELANRESDFMVVNG